MSHSQIIIFVIANQASPLFAFWKDYQQSNYVIKNLPFVAIDYSSDHAINEVLDESLPSDQLLLFLIDNDHLQKKLAHYKIKRKHPVLIVRFWDSPSNIANHFINKYYFNKLTTANLYLSREIEKTNSNPPPGFLRIENPIHLDQKHLWGEDGKFRMLKHFLESLDSPTRIDELGNQKKDYSSIQLSVATHFYINQNNIETLIQLIKRYSKYSREVLDRVQFVFVDDGSPINYTIPDNDLNITWIKINQDIKWNNPGARNLALLYCRANNVIISDVDHHFPEHTLSYLTQKDCHHYQFHKFYCKYADGHIGKGHPNIFYLSRGRFFELHGMDEEFCGSWASDDVHFVKNMKYHGTILRYLPKKYYCEETKIDREKSYHSLFRDQSFNVGAYARKRMEWEYYGKSTGHSKMALNFTWEILMDNIRPRPAYKINNNWQKKWLFRQFKSIISSIIN